ncbi:nitrogen regulation protein NR(II) [Chloroflexota bacterium]
MIDRPESAQTSKDWHQTLFDLATDAMFIYTRTEEDTPGKFIEVNQAACNLLGYTKEELLNLSLLDITPRDQFKQKVVLRKQLKLEKYVFFETVRIAKSGETIPVESHARLIEFDGKVYIFTITRDIRDRKRREEKTHNMEKLAFLGEITSGIAHDIRNPLNVVSNAASLIEKLVKDKEADPKIIKLIELLKTGVEKATNVVDNLMGAVREPKIELKKVLIHQQIGNMIRKTKIPENVQLVVENREVIGKLPPIMANPKQLERVFYNLIINAIEAMPDGGTITIHPSTNDGYLRVEITDTGMGIPPENTVRIFEPLFTSKTESGGTGLGLSVCKTIIEAHGGTIGVESGEGKGTRFIIQIPLSSE